MMVEMTCPWCEERTLLAFLTLATDDSFTCADCGTTVDVVDEPVELDLAA